MNRYIEVVNGHDIKNIGHPRRLGSEKNKLNDRFQFSENEFYEEYKTHQKYSRSERKDLIRMAKKIYIQ